MFHGLVGSIDWSAYHRVSYNTRVLGWRIVQYASECRKTTSEDRGVLLECRLMGSSTFSRSRSHLKDSRIRRGELPSPIRLIGIISPKSPSPRVRAPSDPLTHRAFPTMFLRGGLRRSLSYTTKIISPATGAPSHPVNDSELRNMRDTEWQRRSMGMRGPRLELRDHPPWHV
ncbi:hypothetical protein BO86DRAFT_389584 [Aspergillus japonicus CBS 114.51]|uniref:Uncharacterized protein n=1 Tax=Aspergillus japonicus CBS 114.51 TaxID=1448312 RepID=A0A8T8X010_ASPJA|nr:hypothetical protein BO86DRAFT_389584 [Aspergillus japonicus CBS 114.51]RAH81361.1 hypothetical protein BO86DRAFT_389584 [Aspergillus japonicus CBS 114.51]